MFCLLQHILATVQPKIHLNTKLKFCLLGGQNVPKQSHFFEIAQGNIIAEGPTFISVRKNQMSLKLQHLQHHSMREIDSHIWMRITVKIDSVIFVESEALIALSFILQSAISIEIPKMLEISWKKVFSYFLPSQPTNLR